MWIKRETDYLPVRQAVKDLCTRGAESTQIVLFLETILFFLVAGLFLRFIYRLERWGTLGSEDVTMKSTLPRTHTCHKVGHPSIPSK
jgi:hypothetical protein